MSAADTLARKADFPGLVAVDGREWHYLDTAATAQKPQVVIDAVSAALGASSVAVQNAWPV